MTSAPAQTVDASAVISALEQQLGCYQRLVKLVDVQRAHVEHGDAEALLTVLARRQGVLDELSKLESTVAPVRRSWASFVQTQPDSTRQKVESLMSSARTLLEQITRADQDDVMLLQQRKINVGKQIKAATESRQVNRAYAASAYAKRPGTMDLSK